MPDPAAEAQQRRARAWGQSRFPARAGALCVPGLSGHAVRRDGSYPARPDPWCGNSGPDCRLGQPGRLRGTRSW